MSCTNCANCPIANRCGSNSESTVEEVQTPIIAPTTEPIDLSTLPVSIPKDGEPAKCVVMVSGGLDSLLATKILVNLGLHVIVYHGIHAYEPHGALRHESAKRLEAKCLDMGVKEVVFIETSFEILNLVKNPVYGLGKHQNPCVDCRINNFRNAVSIVKEKGAQFIATGEVVGQRAMSQTAGQMAKVDAEIAKMGFHGLVLRPLCAKNMTISIPERLGWVDREKLYSFSGRTRKPQMQLAKQINLGPYPSPAGGCLLTVKQTADRVADLIKHETNEQPITITDLDLIGVGRHVRFSPTQKAVAARRAEEVELLGKLAPVQHRWSAHGVSGTVVLAFGPLTPEFELFLGGLALYYSKSRDADVADVCKYGGPDGITYENAQVQTAVKPLSREQIVPIMIPPHDE
ncbi:hypothetical protein RCL1_000008 [Eukaryota sp. TZLM3-RCL]